MSELMSRTRAGDAAPLVTVAAPRSGRSAIGLLRGTGAAGIASAVVIAIATVVAAIGSLIAPFSPTLPNLALAFVGPAGGHLLGFDFEGRDVLSRILAGAQSSMLGPLAVVAGAMLAAVLLAVIAAWRRELVDAVISSGLDILFAFPSNLLAELATT